LKKYLITNPSEYNEKEISFENYINQVSGFDFILFRDKEKTSLNYKKFAKIFIDVLQSRGYQNIVLHQNPILANQLGAFGVHLNSKQFSEIRKAKDLNLFTIISTHSLEDVELANNLGADAVTFSPIFDTPNKGKAKGVQALQDAINSFPNIKFFALGGVTSDVEIQKLSKVRGLFGFSSIRFFIRKGIIKN
jgi:thiamine-phosphate pyrophosphorylase